MDNEQNVFKLDICWKKGVEPQTFVREASSDPETGFESRGIPTIELTMEEVGRVAKLVEEITAKLDLILKNVHIIESKDDECPF